ncbi:flagellar protein export ATPase FliI [Salinarimonas rosea]|uniref:flagellar protein export ATPase FliI n=1 Tax=Salinarimonas rosea TaxID=552063 RepID=UPI00041EB60F
MSPPRPANALDRLADAVGRAARDVPLVAEGGVVAAVAPGHYRVGGLSPFLKLGERVAIPGADGPQIGEVVRIDARGATVKPFEGAIDARLGTRTWRMEPVSLQPDPTWKGRVVDALGRPIDGRGPLRHGATIVHPFREPPPAMRRARLGGHFRTGVRAIDLFTPLCAGQRIGVFAGSGVGKSTLISMLAAAQTVDTVVIALVGERGREVREFLEETLGANRDKAVMVVSTGDESPMMRRLAPNTAMAIAEFFRDRGEHVLLIADSVTRYAHAARDVALAAGEPAVSRGYPPSVFSDLPRLLERAGPGYEGTGTITGIFSVLVDGDDHNDPVADAIRGTLDGHIVLERWIADRGRYPAMNPLTSISRLSRKVWSPEEQALVRSFCALIARFEETRDLRLMGAWQPGADPDLDRAVAIVPRLYDALRQDPASPKSEDPYRELAVLLKG